LSRSIEDLLGVRTRRAATGPAPTFSFLFFSDVRRDVSTAQKYQFMRDITLFADREGFSAVYIPERHFNEFGAIYANSAVVAAYLIPDTKRVRFRTAGVSLPLHHPAEVVEWWAMNDVLSNGRVDLGFGSGWSKADFILAPANYATRREICADLIPVVQRLWRGEAVAFPGPEGESVSVRVYPRPIQPELNVWLLATQNDAAFVQAGARGYNVFTMLYGFDFAALARKIELYRNARQEAGHDGATGIVSLMLHTFVHPDATLVRRAVEQPLKEYIRTSLSQHLAASLTRSAAAPGDVDEAQILDYAFERYFCTSGIFGPPELASRIVDEALGAGVNDIACLVDFGVQYPLVMESLRHLKTLVERYQ